MVADALEHRAVATKSLSARWARNALDGRWAPLIDLAAAWVPGVALEAQAETLAFVRHAVELARRHRGA